jgi:hypothetical protein
MVALDEEARVHRVQVKTSSVRRKGRWEVMICTRGGNRSWNGLVKRFSPVRCDRLFVVAGDGRRWFIPARSVEGGVGITLGGPKYAEFEVERGRTLAEMNGREIAILMPRGGVPERSKGPHCKCGGSAFAGSNPAPAMMRHAATSRKPAGSPALTAQPR